MARYGELRIIGIEIVKMAAPQLAHRAANPTTQLGAGPELVGGVSPARDFHRALLSLGYGCNESAGV